MKRFIPLLLLLLTSCSTSLSVVSGDDMYFQPAPRIPYPRIIYPTYPIYPYLNYWGYPRYQDRVIIIDRTKTPPPTNYGKRPTREGNNTPPVRGGRSRN